MVHYIEREGPGSRLRTRKKRDGRTNNVIFVTDRAFPLNYPYIQKIDKAGFPETLLQVIGTARSYFPECNTVTA